MSDEMIEAIVRQTLEIIKLKKQIEKMQVKEKENEKKISYYDALEEEGWIDFIEEKQDLEELKDYIDEYEDIQNKLYDNTHQIIKLPEGFSKH